MKTPEEILTKLSAERLAFANIIIQSIERKMEAEFNGTPLNVSVPYSKNQILTVLGYVKNHLRTFKWDITVGKEGESQRDSYTELLITPLT